MIMASPLSTFFDGDLREGREGKDTELRYKQPLGDGQIRLAGEG